MVGPSKISFIQTIKERCRVCYTCVRECPAKAIRIMDGQAEVIAERCIACGNCVRVCSQNAKLPVDSTTHARQILASDAKVAACVAPSFPADFADIYYRRLVAMIKALGFDYVFEVGFGADLVAVAYQNLIHNGDPEKRYISTPCPAVVAYVEKYVPALTNALTPIVSPMIAQARVVRELHGNDVKIIFIGPCIAKKCEAQSLHLLGEVDAVLTFVELRAMFHENRIRPADVIPEDFAPPHPNLGALFPLSRGLLQAANAAEDLVAGEIVATDGNKEIVEAIKEFADGALDARFLDILCCNGCIMGAGMSDPAPLFTRRSRVSQYVRERLRVFDKNAWRRDIHRFTKIDLHREFADSDDQRLPIPSKEKINEVMARMGKFCPADELNCGACGYETCVDHAIAILKGLAESEMCLPNTIEQLRSTVKELAVSNEQLADTQEALLNSEKLASMGQLAAGIAHEVNNPLGVVLMYAHLLLDEAKDNPQLRDDLTMVVEQADRCKKIVSGLLHFARQNKVTLQPINMKDLVERTLKVIHFPDNITYNIDTKTDNPVADLDPDQIIQVVTNLTTNAIAAMPQGGTITFTINTDQENLVLAVADTGSGIPPENLSKIFEPFFSTKQIGKGTGLGLAVTYGIIKMHRGDITTESNADPNAGPTGTTFAITLPLKARKE
ncbi:MAG: 4Fe-4S binding protein [Sedimentisphaerales bacterium]|nr:4Fe-4S binding protein [Sedimentisphaerales bacterium]